LFLAPGCDSYSAADVIAALLADIPINGARHAALDRLRETPAACIPAPAALI
jgi:hypothetical protein